VGQIIYTATIVTLDGSDTNAYGEPCEAGRGYTEQSGFWDPDRDYWQVHDHRSQVQSDFQPDLDPRRPAVWLAERLTARLGAVDALDGEDTFTGARQAIHPGRLTGPQSRRPGMVLGSGTLLGDAFAAARLRDGRVGLRTLIAAGHPEGFTPDELMEAAWLLDISNTGIATA
jgi:hypothetical protein